MGTDRRRVEERSRQIDTRLDRVEVRLEEGSNELAPEFEARWRPSGRRSLGAGMPVAVLFERSVVPLKGGHGSSAGWGSPETGTTAPVHREDQHAIQRATVFERTCLLEILELESIGTRNGHGDRECRSAGGNHNR